MKYKLKVFDLENEPIATNNCTSMWCTEKMYEQLSPTSKGTDAPLYVKIVSTVALQEFTIYGIVDKLNSKSPNASNYKDNEIYVPNLLFNKRLLYSDGMEVEIEAVDVAKLQTAEVVTIKLDEKLVENWSQEEANFASNVFRGKNDVIYDSQMTLLKPRTKAETWGEITDIIPKQKNCKVFRCTSDTKIVLDGLPEDKQKVIDFSKIGGLTDLIYRLREIIQIPLNFPELLTRFGIKPPKGLLMYGPPGNGKTMIARAVSYSMGSKFITIQGPEFMSKYVGVAEQQLRETFEEAEKIGNCVIFIDEIDSVASKRDDKSAEWQISFVSTLLNLMDGIRSNSRVLVIGATNRLNAIDPALRRPGRFDIEFEVPQPATDARYDILTKYIDVQNQSRFTDTVSDKLLHIISELTNGYSGADINLLYREAVMSAIRKNLTFDETTGKIKLTSPADSLRVDKSDFMESLKNIKPTSLRGTDVIKSTRPWDDIWGLDEQKLELTKLHNALENVAVGDNYEQRLGIFNVVLSGKKGSGRRTLMDAFSTRFNYEMLHLDMLSLYALPMEESFAKVEEVFSKAKQIAPSILMILNADHIPADSILFDKIINEIGKLGKRQRIIVAAKVENVGALPNRFVGYKAFEKVIDFTLTSEQIGRVLQNKMNVSLSPEELKDKTIGQIITKQIEKNVLND